MSRKHCCGAFEVSETIAYQEQFANIPALRRLSLDGNDTECIIVAQLDSAAKLIFNVVDRHSRKIDR